MTTLGEQVCKNCGNGFTENFCNRCGQREAHRITIGHVLHDLVHVFLHADKGIFPFMSRVVFYPGIVAREYLDGKRKIFNPFQYLLFGVAILLFIMNQVNFYEQLETINQDSAKGLPAYYAEGMRDYNEFTRKNANIISLVSLPLFALFSYLFFQAQRRNYAEHITIIVFSFCQVYTLNCIAMLGALLFDFSTVQHVTISMFIMLGSFILTFRQTFNIKITTAIWKGLVVFIIAYLVQAMLMLFGLVFYILIFKRPG